MRVSSTLKKIARVYGNKVRFVYKHYIVHPGRATIPALAACAAQHQGKFMPMYDLIFSKFGRFGQADMDLWARRLRLNMRKFKADMKGRCETLIRQDMMELARVGARGVPAFFINGRFLSGNQPYPNFKRLIDQELSKAQRSGVPVRSYYERRVVQKGKKTL